MKTKGSILSIPAVRLPDGTSSAPQDVDLAAYRGMHARVYIDAAGAVHVNPTEDMYWQIAEMSLAPVISGGSGPVPALDLAAVTITAFTLP